VAKVLIDIEIYSEFNNSLERIWVEFEKKAVMSPFQSYAWLSNWQQTVGGPLLSVLPQVVRVTTDNKTQAIFPFGIRKSFGIKILEWLGGINADYMGPLFHSSFFDNEYLLQNIWNKVKSEINNFDVIHFQRQTDKTIQFLKKIDFAYVSNNNLKLYKATLPPTWNEYYSTVKQKIRSDSRRQRIRLEKIGHVKFNFAENTEGRHEVIQEMIKQKSRRYRETGIWDMLAVDEYKKFYHGLADLQSNVISEVHCTALNVGDVTVATHVGFVAKDTFYYLMPTYEGGEWGKYSPGRLLLLELIKWSINNGLKYFDFTVGGEAYKKNWCNIEAELYETINPVGIRGWAYVSTLETKRVLRKISIFRKLVRAIRN
jgi:CelD/BcsL family acetyltransferase involved in cellulose biosynthesis